MRKTTKQAADHLGVSPSTLNSWRCRERPGQPAFYSIGSKIYYDTADLDSWLAANRHEFPQQEEFDHA